MPSPGGVAGAPSVPWDKAACCGHCGNWSDARPMNPDFVDLLRAFAVAEVRTLQSMPKRGLAAPAATPAAG